jgi:hypothetical protein
MKNSDKPSQKAAKLRGIWNKEKYLMKRNGMTCDVCKESFPRELLDFHHLVEEEKNFSMHVAKFRTMKIKQEVLDEADKCAILCSNCHRLEHVALKNGESIINDPSAYRRYRNHRVTRYESLDDWYDERSGRGTQLSFSI